MKRFSFIQGFFILVTTIGCLYFIYDNIIFLANFNSWVPDREINFTASIGMLVSSIITFFNMIWLAMILYTKRSPLKIMKPVLAVSGALSLMFSLSLAGLIFNYMASEKAEFSTVLISLFTVSVIGGVIILWKYTFSSKPFNN
ncbi:MAG: hypothetical protein HY811_09950 [Planctomycetes bacterium]|nr:hypothetical protein [Planctomycetota bacterium]